MFDFLKKKDLSLYAPMTGQMIEVNSIPDEVFASQMLGETVAFIPQDDYICAPCDGKITMIAHTFHAFGMVSDMGVEILIHIGLETVHFHGKGFEILVHEGERVKKGQMIMRIDRQFFKEKDVCLITPMVITNKKNYHVHIDYRDHVIKGESRIIELI